MDYNSSLEINSKNDTDLSHFLKNKIRRYKLRYQVIRVSNGQAPAFFYFEFYQVEYPEIYEISSNNSEVI